jgi:hypothetical protein
MEKEKLVDIVEVVANSFIHNEWMKEKKPRGWIRSLSLYHSIYIFSIEN